MSFKPTWHILNPGRDLMLCGKTYPEVRPGFVMGRQTYRDERQHEGREFCQGCLNKEALRELGELDLGDGDSPTCPRCYAVFMWFTEPGGYCGCNCLTP